MLYRRGLIEKVAAEEQRREEAEDEVQYQIHQRRELQKQWSTPAGAGLYEDLNMEECGYSIPDFVKADKSGREGYEQLPKPETAPTLPEPRPTSAVIGRANSYGQEPEPHYSRSLPPIYNDQ